MTVSEFESQIQGLLGRQDSDLPHCFPCLLASSNKHLTEYTESAFTCLCNLFLSLSGFSLPPIICLLIRLELALN